MAPRRDPKVAALKSVPLFSGLTKTELQSLAAVTDEVDLKVGTFLFKEGEYGKQFFVILDGTAKVTANGKHLMTAGPDDFLGDISLLVGSRRRATAVVTSPMRAFVMTSRDFLGVLQAQPSVELKVLRSVADRVLQTTQDPTA